jgi:hypothetical protein
MAEIHQILYFILNRGLSTHTGNHIHFQLHWTGQSLISLKIPAYSRGSVSNPLENLIKVAFARVAIQQPGLPIVADLLEIYAEFPRRRFDIL